MAEPSPRTPLVLCVDDAPVCLALARTALRQEGYEVLGATSGAEALALLETARPDLIVLDVQLPDMDGYRVCERIQQHEELSYVPIIFMSAVRTGEEDRARAFALGAVDCLVKPLDRAAFVATVAKHLATRRHWESLTARRDEAPVAVENAPNFARFRMRLAETLDLTDAQRDRLAATRAVNLYDLCDVLGLDQARLAALVAEFLDVPFFPVLDPGRLALGLLPAPFCARNLVVAIEDRPGEVAFALANPFDLGLQQTLRRWKSQDVAPHIAITPPAEIRGLFEETSRALASEAEAAAEDPVADEPEPEDLGGVVTEDSAPLVRLVNSLIERAYAMRASDVHIEPMEDSVVVRYRIDGRLREVNRFRGRVLARPMASRLKVMADLDIVERRLPQDGRIAFRRYSAQGLDLDLRVATTPMQYGEKIVLRLLPRSGALLPLPDLGFSPGNLARYREKLKAPHGMILHVGPTGSGKSMTLYAALNELRDPSINIQTAEDPIEYTLPGINQLQVQPAQGLTFARALRAFLRQDPDVILVGEIRDRETATVAIEAALTGHLLLSTLHTNDAASTIVRLLEMGIEPFLVSSSLLAVCAQRLLRRLCESCKEPYQADDAEARLLGAPAGAALTLYRARGCPACGNVGYKGRIGVHELLIPDHAMRLAITREGMTAERLKQFAVEQSGLVTLYWDAAEKVRAGVCSLDEMLAEIAPDEFASGPGTAGGDVALAVVGGPPAPPRMNAAG